MLDEIDCVVHGTAPDAFDGVHQKAEFLSDGSGAYKKPYMRNYVGGGTGVYAPIHGWFHVASGMFDTCMVVCEEKMSALQPHPQSAFLTIFDHHTERPLGPNLLWIFALEMNRYMTRHGLTLEEIADGVERQLKLRKFTPCEVCDGSGAEGDAGYETCPTCQGQGEVRTVSNSILGQFVNVQTCPTCAGEGRIVVSKCEACGGEGRQKGEETVTVEVPLQAMTNAQHQIKQRTDRLSMFVHTLVPRRRCW